MPLCEQPYALGDLVKLRSEALTEQERKAQVVREAKAVAKAAAEELEKKTEEA